VSFEDLDRSTLLLGPFERFGIPRSIE
jgi:hypothetical protein